MILSFSPLVQLKYNSAVAANEEKNAIVDEKQKEIMELKETMERKANSFNIQVSSQILICNAFCALPIITCFEAVNGGDWIIQKSIWKMRAMHIRERSNTHINILMLSFSKVGAIKSSFDSNSIILLHRSTEIYSTGCQLDSDPVCIVERILFRLLFIAFADFVMVQIMHPFITSLIKAKLWTLNCIDCCWTVHNKLWCQFFFAWITDVNGANEIDSSACRKFFWRKRKKIALVSINLVRVGEKMNQSFKKHSKLVKTQ